jgi:predicted metal-dependent hydrolase
MKSPRPPLDFTGLSAAWAPDPGFAAMLNAGGALAPAVEPYLNRVMSEAARRLSAGEETLRDEIRMLVRQETEHYRVHDAFNQALYAQGFGALEPILNDLKTALNHQFRNKSFAFNLAYCVGFETYTLYLGHFLFGPGAHYFDDADPRGVDLWRWHLAEEYEHRTVCHDAYTALVGDYPLRVWGTLYVHFHIAAFRRRAAAVLMAGAGATERRRERAYTREMIADLLPRLLPAFSPFYDPRGVGAAEGIDDALARYPEVA